MVQLFSLLFGILFVLAGLFLLKNSVKISKILDTSYRNAKIQYDAKSIHASLFQKVFDIVTRRPQNYYSSQSQTKVALQIISLCLILLGIMILLFSIGIIK